MFLANILSINSANICRMYIGSQMDVGTGAGRRGVEVSCASVCGGADRRQVVRPQSEECPMEGSRGAEGAQREGSPCPESSVL